MSIGASVACPPAARMRSSSSSSAPVVRATATTWWLAASASAIAAPRPREAPVTRAMGGACGSVMPWQIPPPGRQIKDNRLTFDAVRRKSRADTDKGGTRDARTNTDTGRDWPRGPRSQGGADLRRLALHRAGGAGERAILPGAADAVDPRDPDRRADLWVKAGGGNAAGLSRPGRDGFAGLCRRHEHGLAGGADRGLPLRLRRHGVARRSRGRAGPCPWRILHGAVRHRDLGAALHPRPRLARRGDGQGRARPLGLLDGPLPAGRSGQGRDRGDGRLGRLEGAGGGQGLSPPSLTDETRPRPALTGAVFHAPGRARRSGRLPRARITTPSPIAATVAPSMLSPLVTVSTRPSSRSSARALSGPCIVPSSVSRPVGSALGWVAAARVAAGVSVWSVMMVL